VVKKGAVYILASRPNGTLYVGVMADLIKRVWQHREGHPTGFTDQHGVTKLVYHEQFDDIKDAISREKNLKNWQRQWKIELIESVNPDWKDLYDEIVG
jgi:putative endonuclease